MSNWLSLDTTQVIIDGHRCEGWSDEANGLEFSNPELAMAKRGPEGKRIMNSTGNKGGDVTLRFMPNSRSTKFFMQKLASQLNGDRSSFNGEVNYGNGATIQMYNGVLRQAPFGQSLGTEAASMEFIIDFELIVPNYNAALFTGLPNNPSGVFPRSGSVGTQGGVGSVLGPAAAAGAQSAARAALNRLF